MRLVVDGMHLPAPSDARALVIAGERIAWVGRDPDDAPPADTTVELPGAWLTPGLVDAHVHATASGLAYGGLDLQAATSAGDVVARLRAFAATHDDDPVIGGGWQEHGWPVPAPPTADELAAAAPGRVVLLDRVDVHSCLVDPTTLALVVRESDDGVDQGPDHRPTGWLRERAAQRARRLVWARLPAARQARARRALVARAVELGVTSVHEMGHPGLSSLADAQHWAHGDWPIEVLVWWADIDAEVALAHGLRPGGDLFLDGAIGSRTAAVSGGYRDGPDLGGLFHDDEEVRTFFARCTRAGVGGGVHAIGDRAIEQAVRAIEAVAEDAGAAVVRACRHRIEHVELPRPDHAARMAHLGIVVSAQPAFDAHWGGDVGMYAQRFGAAAALHSNPFDHFLAAGCRMAFSSDTPVTPMAPLHGIVAATAHRGGHGIDPASALAAATTGGRHVVHQDDVGVLRAGHRADLALWDGDPLARGGPATCLGIAVRGQITLRST